MVVRAIYEGGKLRLLEPLDLPEGQAVNIEVEPMSDDDVLRKTLSDLVIWPDTSDDSDAWVEDMAEEIDKAFQGDPPLSQIIIEDRGEL
jgi:predicted DNA-binding antitoxin AbrB/MazE fold protein